jgi:hypothetical protein
MAISGRRPSGRGVSINRHNAVHAWVDVYDAPFAEGPKLPPRRANGQRWSAAMSDRWMAWSTMPHCYLWEPSDWQFALDTLEVAARFADSSAVSWSTELRYRERVMGTTHDARQGLRIRYVEPAESSSAAVLSIDQYRDL